MCRPTSASSSRRSKPASISERLNGAERNCDASQLEHDPEKWVPVFPERSCSNKKIERDDDSEKSHHALARQFCHFAARGVIILQDKVDCRKNVGEVWARKWHGLHAAKVQRAIRSDQIERRLRETRALFDARRRHSTSRRDEQSPAARGSEVETIAETQPRQSPSLPGLLRARSRVGGHGDYP